MGLVRNVVGLSEEVVDVPLEARVSDLLCLLQDKHGMGFRDSLMTAGGQLRPLVRIFIEDKNIDEIAGLETCIEPGSGVYILLLDHAGAGG